MFYRLMPDGDQRAQTIKNSAAVFVEAKEGANSLLTRMRERDFINVATYCLTSPLRNIGDHETPEMHFQMVRGFFDALGEHLGEPAYDGTDPEVSYAWTAQALAHAGVANENEQGDYDEEAAEQMVFVPSDAFCSVLHDVDAIMRTMAQDLAKKQDKQKM